MRMKRRLHEVKVAELIDLDRLPAALHEVATQRVHVDRM
jgi:hypothetical protein